MNSPSLHQDQILDQFTRQATPFAEKPEHADAGIFERLIRFSEVSATDEVLDVACGPGLLTRAFARWARHVTGLDLTPAMIAKAGEMQRQEGLTNVDWALGNVMALPYPDNHFSLVMTRYSFHHLLDPRGAWEEMVRVCRPGGTVLAIDVALPREKAESYDQFERLRDPSHARVQTLEAFPALARAMGLEQVRTEFYRLEMELEALIATSFPPAGNAEILRERMQADLGVDSLGFQAQSREGAIWFSFPTLAIAGRKAGPGPTG